MIMRKFYYLILSNILFLGFLNANTIDDSIMSEGGAAEITEVTTQLIEALDNRNFTKAKSKVEQLLPMIKIQLKNSHKAIKTQEKASTADAQRMTEIKKIVEKQEEIFTSLTYLKKVSPVAYRVKAEMVKDLVSEYGMLTERLAEF